MAKKNLELTLSSDSQLRAWFAANRPAIVDLARVHNGAAFPPSPGVTRESHLAASLKALGLKSIDTQDSATRIVIGGRVDHTCPL